MRQVWYFPALAEVYFFAVASFPPPPKARRSPDASCLRALQQKQRAWGVLSLRLLRVVEPLPTAQAVTIRDPWTTRVAGSENSTTLGLDVLVAVIPTVGILAAAGAQPAS